MKIRSGAKRLIDTAQQSFQPALIAEIIRCKNDPAYFIQKYLKVRTPTGLSKFNFYSYQDRVLSSAHEFNRVLIKTPRQSGLTTLMSAYAVWHSVFNTNETIIVACPKFVQAVNAAAIFTSLYDQVPNWMASKIKVRQKTFVELENGSRVKFSAASESLAKGISFSLLLLSDIALYDKRVAEAMWDSIAPGLFSTAAKLIAWSTPVATDDLFSTLWSKADSLSMERITIDWQELPHATDDWAERIQETLGMAVWKSEYLCELNK